MEERKIVISPTETVKASIIANCKRVIEILENRPLEDVKKNWYEKCGINTELRQRMAQIRKDSMKIQKYVSFKEDIR